MADATDELNRFADRMGITTTAAEELFRRLRDLTNSTNSTTSAFEVARDTTARLSQGQNAAYQAVSSFGSSVGQATKSLAGMPEQIAASNSALNSISPVISSITQFAGQLTAITSTGAGTLIGSAFGPIGSLIGGMIGKKVGEFGQEMIGTVGGIMQFFLRQSQNVIDSFTQLSSVGATFGGSLDRLKQMSVETGLSFETLSKIAVSNAENLALLGGGTQGALKLVTRTSNDLGNTLLALYGGFENLNSETAEYMVMRRRQGISEMATGNQLTKETGEYLYMMKELNALTGKNSKQIRAEIEQRTRNAAAQLVISEMTEDERKNFNYQLSLLPEGVKSAYIDMVVASRTGNAAISNETLRLGATMPGITGKLENFVNMLSLAPAEMKDKFGREASGLVEETKNYRTQFKDLLYLTTAGRITGDVVKNIDTVLTSLGENLGRIKTLPEDIETFAKQTNRLKNEAGTFTDQVGLITKEQEKIRIALNKLATEGDRFSMTLGVTQKILNIAELLVDGISDLLPTFVAAKRPTLAEIDKQTVENVEETLKTNPNSNIAKILAARTQRQIEIANSFIRKLESDRDSNVTSADRKEYLNKEIEIQKQQIKRFEELKRKYDDIDKKNNSQNGNQSVSTSSVDLTNVVAETKESVDIITATNTKLGTDITDLINVFKTMTQNQTDTNNNIITAMNNQSDQIRRLSDRLG
jgi:hypothetical protein